MNETLPHITLVRCCRDINVPFDAILNKSVLNFSMVQLSQALFQLSICTNKIFSIIRSDGRNWALSIDEPPDSICTAVFTECLCNFQMYCTTGQTKNKNPIPFKETLSL